MAFPFRALLALALEAGLGAGLVAQQPPLRIRLAAALDAIPAIDGHAHLLEVAPFDPAMDAEVPLPLRATNPALVKALKARFGVAWDPAHPMAGHAAGLGAREALVARLGGEAAYWADHLRAARTEVVLVNQLDPAGTDGAALRWVPTASPLLLPLPAGALQARSPLSAEELGQYRETLLGWMQAAGLRGLPARLGAYLAFLDRQLRLWQRQGALALKFVEAYHRTLRFDPVPRTRAETLWAKGRTHPLNRADYLALQDFLARYLFREAGRLGLPIHLHTGLGGSRRLRLLEADPRNLESLLADPAFEDTTFVLIHAGTPDPRPAAALAAFKPNVWLDLSGLAFYLSPADLAEALKACLLAAPERTLFGTDAFGCFQLPVGPELAHLAFGEALRQALAEALAALVEAGVLDEPGALRLGAGVLRENARRLYPRLADPTSASAARAASALSR